jgi:16S rRNA processing protein RimM
MNEMIFIGKSVSTFGIKGELKVRSDFNYLDKAYKIGNVILINNIEHKISGVRYHKNHVLLKIDNLENINDVLDYVGYNIYIKRSDLNLSSNEYLDSDLINSDVINDGINLGKVIDVIRGVNTLIKVSGKVMFYIPYVDEYIINFDLENKKLYTKNCENLIM